MCPADWLVFIRPRVAGFDCPLTERKRETAGFLPKEPPRGQVLGRLAKLRNHRWSSYLAYAGYAPVPEWLTCSARSPASAAYLKAA